MIGLLNRLRIQSLLSPNCRYVGDYTSHFCSHLENASLMVIRSFSSTESGNNSDKLDLEQQKHSFTVSYLINSCGLSPDDASSASNNVKFSSSDKPDSILKVLKDYGFTDTDISALIRKQPNLLVVKLETTLLPKLKFLNSIGLSSSDLAKVLCWNPSLLTRSLEKHIIPCCNVLKSLVLEDSGEKVAKILKQSSWVFLHHVQRNLATNVSMLRASGASPTSISHMVSCYPSLMALNTDKFRKAVQKVIEMGFDPMMTTFAHGLQAVTQIGKLKWEEKIEVYKRWGWSEDEIWSAIRKHPVCIKTSKKKIMLVMDFLVNKMGWQPSDVARIPTVFCYSLEKRIVPRCKVVKILHLKGLRTVEETPLSSVVTTTDEYFLAKFATKFQDKVPQLCDVFHGNIDISELQFGFEQKSGTDMI